MTCIVGVEHEGHVWLGADSVGISGWSSRARADSKLFERGEFAMGFSTSFRMGQLLRYNLDVPTQAGGDDDEFMATVFVDAVRKCLKDGGFAKKESDVESGGIFLVAYRSRLYMVNSDYQVGRTTDGFDAIGCGGDLAMGALHATEGRPPQERVMTALAAAERFSAGVSGPFTVLVHAAEVGDG